MTPRLNSLMRLMAVQSAWTYERMLGIGVGHASAPFLREVCSGRAPEECDAIVARSAEFFNSHPYLAGVAVGAMVRAERERVPGETILRLRTALSGPLGALGDQLIWAGQVPVLIGLALVGIPWFGPWSVLAAVLVHNVLRVWLTLWGLDLGLREGLTVGGALQRSWLPRVAVRAQQLAAFAIGLALPVVAQWLMSNTSRVEPLSVLGLALGGVVLSFIPIPRFRISGLQFGLLLMLVTLLLVGGFR